MKKTIKLNERDLHRVIKESVKSVLKESGDPVDPNNVQIPKDGRFFPITWQWDGNGWKIFWRKNQFDLSPNEDAYIGHVSIDKNGFAIWIDELEFGNVIFDPNARGNEFDHVNLYPLVSNCMKSCMQDGGYTKRYSEPEDWYERNEHGDFDDERLY